MISLPFAVISALEVMSTCPSVERKYHVTVCFVVFLPRPSPVTSGRWRDIGHTGRRRDIGHTGMWTAGHWANTTSWGFSRRALHFTKILRAGERVESPRKGEQLVQVSKWGRGQCWGPKCFVRSRWLTSRHGKLSRPRSVVWL